MSRCKYVYLIEVTHRFEDGSFEDFSYVWRVYSSLRKAKSNLEFWKEFHTADLLNAGYDIECDLNHWVDYHEDCHYGRLNVKNGCELKTYQISRELLF